MPDDARELGLVLHDEARWGCAKTGRLVLSTGWTGPNHGGPSIMV